MTKASTKTTKVVQIRLDREAFEFYASVAKSAGFTMSDVLCVVLALEIHRKKRK